MLQGRPANAEPCASFARHHGVYPKSAHVRISLQEQSGRRSGKQKKASSRFPKTGNVCEFRVFSLGEQGEVTQSVQFSNLGCFYKFSFTMFSNRNTTNSQKKYPFFANLLVNRPFGLPERLTPQRREERGPRVRKSPQSRLHFCFTLPVAPFLRKLKNPKNLQRLLFPQMVI